MLQKHQRKSIARKCNKCALWFVHKGILKEHQEKDHSSFKDVPGIHVNNWGLEVEEKSFFLFYAWRLWLIGPFLTFF